MLIDYLFCHLKYLREKIIQQKIIKNFFLHYYIPNSRIKDFNVLTDGKGFFDLAVKNKEEAYKKVIDKSNINDYTTGNLSDFVYFQKNYKLTPIDLSKKNKLKDPQQINFIGRILAARGVTMFFIIEKSEETTFEFLQNSVNIL